jgi:hypothetical protein
MSKLLIMCAVSGLWLSIAGLERAEAQGTFRLQGPWPSASAEKNTVGVGVAASETYGGEVVRHALVGRHRQSQTVFR